MRDLDGPASPPKIYASWLEALFDATTMATMLCRLSDGRILCANRRCRKILHLTDEMIENGVTSSMVGLVDDERAEIYRRLQRAGVAREVEMTLLRPGRQSRRLLCAFRVVIVDDEQLVVSNFMDITRRREARRELQETQDQMRLFLDIAPAIISLKGLDGRLFWVNKRAADTFSIPAERVAGATSFDLAAAEVAQRLTALDALVVSTGEVVQREVHLVSGDGEKLTYDMMKFPVPNLDRETYAIGTIAVDITDRRRSEEVLRESEARFRQLASSMDGAWVLWQTDPLEVLYASPGIGPLMGIPPDSVTFPSLLAAAHPDDRAALQSQVLQSEDWDGRVVRDFRVVDANGATRWIRTRTARVVGSEHDRRSTILIDVTDWKDAQVELETARAIAERASTAKNDFLSRMSHELRTPLHAILGFGQLMHSEMRTDAQRSLTDQIARAGTHLLRLIDEVLDISQIEGGFMRLNIEPVSLLDVVTEALELVAPSAVDNDCTIRVEGELAGVAVMADRTRLKQVLLNVVSNAIKYNRRGGMVLISVDAGTHERVRVNVVDRGMGIAEEAMGRLFEPFDRLGAEKTRVPGAGLGLALARELMTLMDGDIGAASTVGVGTRVWLELEPADAELVEKTVRRSSRAVGERRSYGRALRVLVVENDRASTALLDVVLQQRPSIIATFAKSGAEGIALLRERDVDFVLLDMHLGDMTGTELLALRRAENVCPTAQIVMLSADAMASSREHALAMGAAAYLTKPFDADELWGVLDDLTIQDGGGLSFVYADDDELCRQFMVRLFERCLPAARLRLAANGVQALEVIREEPPDILLLDINLADMSGFDVIEAVRGEPSLATLPIVVMSADSSSRRHQDAPLLHWLAKPFTVADFLRLVAELA